MRSSSNNRQVYITGVFAAIGGLLFGYDTGVISGVLTMSDFLLAFGGVASLQRGSLSSSVAGSIVGIMLVGCFFGALFAAPSGDRFSRKYSIVIFSLIFIVSAFLQTIAVNLFMLLLSRFIAGKGSFSLFNVQTRISLSRRCGRCVVHVGSCLSIRDRNERDSRSSRLTSAMGNYHRHCCELLDQLW
jgi:MFS family permease